MGVMLTRLGTFLDKEEYSQMVFAACDAMVAAHFLSSVESGPGSRP